MKCMLARRITWVGSTHCSALPVLALNAGSGTRADFLSSAAYTADDSVASTVHSTRNSRFISLFLLHFSLPLMVAHAHLDVAGRADIRTDVAADTQIVVGVHVTAHGGLGLGGALDRGLRAVDDAVVAFKAHAAAHAALGFSHGLRFIETDHALLEMAQHFLGAGHLLGALDAFHEREVTEEQLVGVTHLGIAAILVVVHGESANRLASERCAAQALVDGARAFGPGRLEVLRRQTGFLQFGQ